MRLPLRLLGRRLPRTRGRLSVSGLHGALAIHRDRWGVPHIEALNPDDAWFGLGFCHAQDRPFQLELMLRIGRGTLSALVGAGGISADRMSRRLGFRRVAEAQLPRLADDVRAAMDAYVRGVNAGLSRGLPRRPHEFVLLRSRPSRWEELDVLAFAGLQSFALSANWDVELARLKILAEDGPDALLALDPRPPDELPVSVPVAAAAGPALDRLADDLRAFAAAAPSSGGSNNWAIAGERTTTGQPLLANDPHLAARLPAPWYLAHLRCPEWEVAGASFVGAPALPTASNGKVAWGITAGLTDQVDLFVEETGPDGASVRGPGGWTPCEVRSERIEVRGGEAIDERVLVTPRGPIISPLLADAPAAVSMSATWLLGLPIRGLLDTVRAHDFASFRRPFAEWPGPALNLVFADTAGHIGYQLVGQLPRRRRGHGTLPLPGWLPDVGWEDELVPFDEMPFALDPPAGFVASANNRPAPDGEGAFLGADFMEGFRQARIVETLQGHAAWDADACRALQQDVTALPWRLVCERVLSLPVLDDAGRRGQDLLGAWNGSTDVDSSAASVYELWLAEMSERIARAKAPHSWRWAMGAGFGDLVPLTTFHTAAAGRVVRLLEEQPDGWFEDGWAAEASRALSAAVRRLESEHGADPAAWGWGRLRPLSLRHPMGDQPLLAASFNLGPVPFPGDGTTPLQAATGPLAPLANPDFLPNMRAVIDLGDPDASRWVLAGGQSGNPCSPHYADLFPLWLAGESVPIPFSRNAVAAATVQTLQLEPEAER
ncbi:MAG TPA: penicillin acylase family protein [Candidatus Limnocylindrales bacterium]|nr:penicillin acylase family protein [Candidatus Limnocylindrales bacterium]